MPQEQLVQKKCVPCEGGMPPLGREAAAGYLTQVPGWEMDADAKKISRKFEFKDFVQAMVFVNQVAQLAEAEGHHPDIHISWNRVRLELFTHVIRGLSENDFILAAKINEIVHRIQ